VRHGGVDVPDTRAGARLPRVTTALVLLVVIGVVLIVLGAFRIKNRDLTWGVILVLAGLVIGGGGFIS
jgi:hypothetical protein